MVKYEVSQYIIIVTDYHEFNSLLVYSFSGSHPIDYDAEKSQWFIYINPKGIKWGNQLVYLIITLASSKKYEKRLRKVFDELSEVIINDNKVSKLTASKNV